MTDEMPTLNELVDTGATIERHPNHPQWWRATRADGTVVTHRRSAYSRTGAETWDGYAACWCFQDSPHEPDCAQGLYPEWIENERDSF